MYLKYIINILRSSFTYAIKYIQKIGKMNKNSKGGTGIK